MKKTKIICSIGPASSSIETMSKMVDSGMDVARINFSHATLEEKESIIKTIREVEKINKKNIAILYDTKGPEFRNGNLFNNEIKLVEGNTIKIVKKDILGNEKEFSVNHPQAIEYLNIGDIILLENGLMKIKVIEKDNDSVNCEIITGGILGNKKSMSVPGVQLNIPFISDVDKEDIIYACKNEGDFLALSFVSTKKDILKVKEILKQYNREDMKIISKIESRTGIDNIEEILEESDGIMVARGDLGVEIPMEELPIVQKRLIQKCREYGKIAIVATEMLESMKKNIRPTRAEVSDVANAVLDGTDAVMLSGETTTGKFPIEVVKYMSGICLFTERNYCYNPKNIIKRKIDSTEAIAKSVISCSNILNTNGIVVSTQTGYSAKVLSNLKPNNIIIATCPYEKVVRSLSLNWGVYPVLVPFYKSTDDIIQMAKDSALKIFNLKNRDHIIITGGFHTEIKNKTTNFMKIEEI